MKKIRKFPKNPLIKPTTRPYDASVGTEVAEERSRPDRRFPGNGAQRFAHHIPVMPTQVVQALQVRSGGSYIDGTVGEGGHLEAIRRRCQPGGRVLGLDADEDAVAGARERFAPYQDHIVLAHGNFRDLGRIATLHGFGCVQGVLLDLGLSTLQLGSGRGFSFLDEAPLDMRFDGRQPLTADEVVNRYPEKRLAHLLTDYGQEPKARQIARAIVQQRPVRTAYDLAQVVCAALRRSSGRIHPATRTFQAIRMEVNQELASLDLALHQVAGLLEPGGRVAVISFNSLEDRLVKRIFQAMGKGCVCPPSFPVCTCGQQRLLTQVEPKLLRPSPEEVQNNLRSRSARMRVAERLLEG